MERLKLMYFVIVVAFVFTYGVFVLTYAYFEAKYGVNRHIANKELWKEHFDRSMFRNRSKSLSANIQHEFNAIHENIMKKPNEIKKFNPQKPKKYPTTKNSGGRDVKVPIKRKDFKAYTSRNEINKVRSNHKPIDNFNSKDTIQKNVQQKKLENQGNSNSNAFEPVAKQVALKKDKMSVSNREFMEMGIIRVMEEKTRGLKLALDQKSFPLIKFNNLVSTFGYHLT